MDATRQRWEQLILELLERADPVRSRWLQEHPQRNRIMDRLVAEADETLTTVNSGDLPNPQFWTSVPPLERPVEVAAVMVQSPELWEEIDEAWPNPAPQPPDPARGPLPWSIPPSAPTRKGWSRPD